MTFTTNLKEEISKIDESLVEDTFILQAFLRYNGVLAHDELTITLENASVTRKIYKSIKKILGINPNLTIRVQKRFRVKKIYIIVIKNINDFIKNAFLENYDDGFDSPEEKISYLKGAFLAIGNVSNPQTSGYHMEFICKSDKDAKIIKDILLTYHFNAKIITRGYKRVVYIKASEEISDILKLFKATQSMFFFEDIRIYRDHKNMVNRLNNCEVSNQTKIIASGQKQLAEIKYLEENDLISLLDDKDKTIIEARKKYPEVSYAELANIISLEYDYKIGKSGINHHFIKLSKMVEKHKKNNGVIDEN